jgi:hypothetical protein
MERILYHSQLFLIKFKGSSNSILIGNSRGRSVGKWG